MKLKSSFVYVVFFLYRFGFLLAVIPLRDVIFDSLPPKIAVYLYRSDICALCLLCVWASLSLTRIFMLDTDKNFIAHKGVLIKRETHYPKNKLHILHLSQGIFLRLCKACRVELFSSQASSAFFLSKNDCRHLFCKKPHFHFTSGLFSSLIFSAGFSGALTGLLSLVPLLRNIASLLGEKQTQSILTYADLWQAAGYTAAPPFLRILSSLFFFAWLAGAAVEFFRYYRLRLTNCNGSIILEHGLIKHHTLVLNKSAISALVKRQSILLYLTDLFTLEAYVSHSKESKIPLLLASRKKLCQNLMQSLYSPNTKVHSDKIAPPENTLWGYTWKPVLFIFLLSVGNILTDALTPFHTEPHLALFLTLWGVVWFLFSLVSHKSSALLYNSESITIRSTKGLSFIEATIPLSKVSAMRTTQNIFQKRKGVCHLYVHIPSSRGQRFLIKHINKKETAQLTKM